MSNNDHSTDTSGKSTKGSYDSKGYWSPPYTCSYAPFISRPWSLGRFFKWFFGYPGFLWPNHLLFFGIAASSWFLLTPSLEEMITFRIGWITLIFARNMGLTWFIYGMLHLILYTFKLHGTDRKYDPKWQTTGNRQFLFKSQTLDNIFRACVYGVPIWTGWEVLYLWLAANGRVPLISWEENPVWFAGLFLLIPFWRETHFYFIHKLLHWKPLLRTIHTVHHKNPNPGPWSGLAMHPLEHLMYFSVAAVHFIVPSHPLHFLFTIQVTGLIPANDHTGFEPPLFKGRLHTGSYFHYLHHRYVSCNFGGSKIPWDRWLGRFYDGTGQYRTRRKKENG